MKPSPSAPARLPKLPSLVETGALDVRRLRLVLPTEGVSLRTLASGRALITNQLYLSSRHEATHPCEAETELVAAEVEEVDTDIVKVHRQFARLEVPTDNGIACSILDGWRLYADGSSEIVEYKRDWHQFDSARAQVQETLGRLAADALGSSYRQITLNSLGDPMYLDT